MQSTGVQILPNHVSLSQNQNPWFYRTSWNCGGGGELFGSVTVKNVGKDPAVDIARLGLMLLELSLETVSSVHDLLTY